jgi:hypothetical protein
LTRIAASELRRAAATRWSGVAVGVLALLVVAAAQLLAGERKPTAAPVTATAFSETATSRETRTFQPPAPSPVPDSNSEPRSTLPVLTPDDLPLETATAEPTATPPSAPVKASEAKRKGKKPIEARARASDSAPSSTMSEAMVRIGALMARGADKRPASGSGDASPKAASPKEAAKGR